MAAPPAAAAPATPSTLVVPTHRTWRVERYEGGPIPRGARFVERHNGELLAWGVAAFTLGYVLPPIAVLLAGSGSSLRPLLYTLVPVIGPFWALAECGSACGPGSAITLGVVATFAATAQVAGVVMMLAGASSRQYVVWGRPPGEGWSLGPQGLTVRF